MLELAIAAACGSLAGTIITLTKQIGAFAITVSDAQKDMEDAQRELAGLLACLQTLRADTSSGENDYPEALVSSLLDVLKNCGLTMAEIAALLNKMQAPNLARKMQWAAVGEAQMKKLRFRLEAHKATLEIALVMTSISVTAAVKRDVAGIKNDTGVINEVNDNMKMLVEEIQRLRIQVAQAQPLDNDRPYALQRFLDDSSNYAESVVDTDNPPVSQQTVSSTLDWESVGTLDVLRQPAGRPGRAGYDNLETDPFQNRLSFGPESRYRDISLSQQSIDHYVANRSAGHDLRKTKIQDRLDRERSPGRVDLGTQNQQHMTMEPPMKSTSMPEERQRRVTLPSPASTHPSTMLSNMDRALLHALGKISQQTPRLAHNIREREAETIERLLIAGADPHALGWEGDDRHQTHSIEYSFGGRSGHVYPLEIAARKGRVDILVILFRHGAEARKKMDKPYLHLFGSGLNATVANYQGDENRWNQATTVQYLLEKGVNVNSRNALGYTALQYGKSYSSDSNEQSTKVLRMLLEKGADVNCDADQNTPLICELLDEQLITATTLLTFGANVNKKCFEHGNALLHAMKSGQNKMARLLLDRGADVNVIDRELESPLLVATENLDDVMVRELLKRGADVAYEGSGGNAKAVAQRKRQELTGSFSHKTQAHMRYYKIWMYLQKSWSPCEDDY